jgi:hypothetical protein
MRLYRAASSSISNLVDDRMKKRFDSDHAELCEHDVYYADTLNRRIHLQQNAMTLVCSPDNIQSHAKRL